MIRKGTRVDFFRKDVMRPDIHLLPVHQEVFTGVVYSDWRGDGPIHVTTNYHSGVTRITDCQAEDRYN